MNDFIKQMLLIVGSYLLTFIGTIIFMNIQSKGLLLKYLFVKARKKKRMIIFIRGVTGPYIRMGKIIESKLHWKNAGKDQMSAPLDYEGVFDFNGVSAITYDEVNNNFIKLESGKELNKGIDPVQVDIMVKRAYLLGLIKNASNILIIMIISIIILLAVLFIIYQVVKIGKDIDLAINILNNISMTLNPPVIPI